MGAGLTALAALGPAGCAASSGSSPLQTVNTPSTLTAATSAIDRAYAFLGYMMDSYATGTSLRLARSYVPTPALDLGDVGFLYDNALAIVALLGRGRSDDLARATVLGDSILYAQKHDPAQDGRLRDSYHTNPFVRSDGTASVAGSGSAVGNMAWAGIALLQLYQRTHTRGYLDAAGALGTWIDANAGDNRGAGGFTGGVDATGLKLQWKSAEHNIDCFTLFRGLARLTIGSSTWGARSQQALALVQSMWDPTERHFWTGTVDDGITINRGVIPEDVQSWSFLATLNPTYVPALLWAEQHLAASPGNFYGVSFSTADLNGVWLEGTGHLAAALKASGKRVTAQRYLQAIEYAQKNAQHADGMGIVASSRDGLQTGFGWQYFSSLHTGATAWYSLAKLGINPLRV
jgi:hypothetical protein